MIHLNKSTSAHSPSFWCGLYAPSAEFTEWAESATCTACLAAALKESRRLEAHYLGEMNKARAGYTRLQRLDEKAAIRSLEKGR